MPGRPDQVPADEIERLRRGYEDSLSWRLTRPVRAMGRLARRAGPSGPPAAPPAAQHGEPLQEPLDSWLEQYYGPLLTGIDDACARETGEDPYGPFRGLDDDLWALLLTQQYARYPSIKALLPDVPAPDLQELWNGRSGVALAIQTSEFCRKLRTTYECHGGQPIDRATVLDFGCGWGRLTRNLARDVAPDRLHGCDALDGILDECRHAGVPGRFASSSFLPDRLPFETPFASHTRSRSSPICPSERTNAA